MIFCIIIRKKQKNVNIQFLPEAFLNLLFATTSDTPIPKERDRSLSRWEGLGWVMKNQKLGYFSCLLRRPGLGSHYFNSGVQF